MEDFASVAHAFQRNFSTRHISIVYHFADHRPAQGSNFRRKYNSTSLLDFQIIVLIA